MNRLIRSTRCRGSGKQEALSLQQCTVGFPSPLNRSPRSNQVMKKMTPAKRLKSKEHKRLKMIAREKRMADLVSELRERAEPLTEDQSAHLKAIASE